MSDDGDDDDDECDDECERASTPSSSSSSVERGGRLGIDWVRRDGGVGGDAG